MGLKEMVLGLVIVTVILTGALIMIGDLPFAINDPVYSNFMNTAKTNLTDYSDTMSKNVTTELENSESETAIIDTNQITMGKSLMKALKTILKTPATISSLIILGSTALNIPAELGALLLTIFFIILSFAIYSIIRGYEI